NPSQPVLTTVITFVADFVGYAPATESVGAHVMAQRSRRRAHWGVRRPCEAGTSTGVDQLALGVQRDLLLQATDTAHARHHPYRAEFFAMRRSGGAHRQLLEAVLEAPTAGMAAGDPLGASSIDGAGQSIT